MGWQEGTQATCEGRQGMKKGMCVERRKSNVFGMREEVHTIFVCQWNSVRNKEWRVCC